MVIKWIGLTGQDESLSYKCHFVETSFFVSRCLCARWIQSHPSLALSFLFQSLVSSNLLITLFFPLAYINSHTHTHISTHAPSLCLPRCALVQVYVFTGAHHCSNENDHRSSVFIHIQQRAPATVRVSVWIRFLGCLWKYITVHTQVMCVRCGLLVTCKDKLKGGSCIQLIGFLTFNAPLSVNLFNSHWNNDFCTRAFVWESLNDR